MYKKPWPAPILDTVCGSPKVPLEIHRDQALDVENVENGRTDRNGVNKARLPSPMTFHDHPGFHVS